MCARIRACISTSTRNNEYVRAHEIASSRGLYAMDTRCLGVKRMKQSVTLLWRLLSIYRSDIRCFVPKVQRQNGPPVDALAVAFGCSSSITDSVYTSGQHTSEQFNQHSICHCHNFNGKRNCFGNFVAHRDSQRTDLCKIRCLCLPDTVILTCIPCVIVCVTYCAIFVPVRL